MKVRIILFLMLLCGLGCPRGVQSQGLNKAKANNTVPIDSMDARQLIAYVVDFHFFQGTMEIRAAIDSLKEEGVEDADFWCKMYLKTQFRQDMTDSLYSYYLKVYAGNEKKLKELLVGILEGNGRILWDGQSILGHLVSAAATVVQEKKPKTDKEEISLLTSFWDEVKRNLPTAKNAGVYKTIYEKAGYAACAEKELKCFLSPTARTSEKMAKVLNKTLPEVFARMATALRLDSKTLKTLLEEDASCVSFYAGLYDNILNKNILNVGEKTKEYIREQKKGGYAGENQLPSFPGGESAVSAFVARHINYPQSALENEIEGVVYLKFLVLEDGKVGDVIVIRNLDPACDAEAVRVVRSLPRFIPGKIQGKPVKVWYALPVRFQIQ